MWSRTVPLHSGAEGHQAGISVLDTDSSTSPRIIRSQISAVALLLSQKQFKVPLASDWKLDFDMSEETGSGFLQSVFSDKGTEAPKVILLALLPGAHIRCTAGRYGRGQLLYTALTAEDGTVDRCSRRNHAEGADLFASENELLHKR